MPGKDPKNSAGRFDLRTRPANVFRATALWLLLALLAWAPFPLGSNRPWSWSVLVIGVALIWSLWSISAALRPEILQAFSRIRVPLGLAVIVLTWAVLQASTWLPESWAHPVWQLASDTLGDSISGSVSIAPWQTMTAVMKFLAYGAAFLVTVALAQRAENAARILTGLIVLGIFYSIYALLMGIFDLQQLSIFYPAYSPGPEVERFGAPFVSQNNFATYIGLLMLCASARLYDSASRTIVVSRGSKQFGISAFYFLFGVGALAFAAFCLTFGLLVASGSRAGFISGLAGLTVFMSFAGVVAGRGLSRGWAITAVLVIILGILSLFLLTGNNLEERLNALVETRGIDETRILLWQSAIRMITDAPFLGLGLGTYEAAYPLYADRVLPFIMDKAHNDYLEFVAGIGLPAAFAWCMAIIWLLVICVRGFFTRRRDRQYALLGLSAAALVGVHSLFDFSLQIPAIALTFAVILGLGVAQSASSRERSTALQ